MKLKSLLIIALLLLSAKVFSNEITFTNGTYAEVLAKAKAENKVIMIDFYTDWCKWCVELDNKVYTNSDVADFANAKQINWKIDAEKGEGVDLAKKFNVSGYPTVIFVDTDGEEIDRIIGYLPAKDFLVAMKDIVNGKNTTKSLQAALISNPEDVEALYRLGKKIFDTGKTDEAAGYFKKAIELDPNNKSGWIDDAELSLAQINNKKEDIEAFVKKYPDSELTKIAIMYLAELALETNDYTAGDNYYKQLISKYGSNDEEINFGYGQYLLTKIYALNKKENKSKDDYKKGIEMANECLNIVKGSVNEASCYFYLSEFYLQTGDKTKANEYIDKALKIHDRKSFRDQKGKINK